MTGDIVLFRWQPAEGVSIREVPAVVTGENGTERDLVAFIPSERPLAPGAPAEVRTFQDVPQDASGSPAAFTWDTTS